MELIGGGENRDDTIYGTAHWADANGNHQSRGSGPVELPDPQFFHQDYHVFELEWNATTLTWRLDGRQYFTLSIAGADMDEFRQPFFLLLNVAVGGNWPGSPNRTTVFPQEMRVDWVRVYQAAP
jgi:beta-glucanase (GH16 family)